LSGRRKAWFNTRFHEAATYRRERLLSGNRISGPALIEEHASTTVLMPGDRMMVDDYGNLIIRVAGAKR
jgi:N-methylhydantoinase A/oxoprolinase/acetone carboxylase beta subunit